MKQHLVHLMKYNQTANKQVIKLLTELDDSSRTMDRKSYYKSLQGIFEHIAGGALYLQKLTKASCPEITGLNHKYMEFKIEPGKSDSINFAEYANALEALDSAFVDMVEALSDEDLDKTVLLTFSNIKLEYPLAVFIMQYASHGTHHRGQISQILDEMGISNDFSSIAPKYE